MEVVRFILPHDVDISKRARIMFVRRGVQMQTEANMPRLDAPIGFLEGLHSFRISRQRHSPAFRKSRIDKGKTLGPFFPVKVQVELLYPSSEGIAVRDFASNCLAGSFHIYM